MTTKQRIIKLEKEKNTNRAVNRYAYTSVVDETLTGSLVTNRRLYGAMLPA